MSAILLVAIFTASKCFVKVTGENTSLIFEATTRPAETSKLLKLSLLKNSNRTGGRKKNRFKTAVRSAAREGLQAVIDLYEKKELEMFRKGEYLPPSNPAAQLSAFSAPVEGFENLTKIGYASLFVAKKLKQSIDLDLSGRGREAPPKISLRRTPLEGLCPPREPPICPPFTWKYRTHDGTCNNFKRSRWGAAQMPFNRYLAPEYTDGLEEISDEESQVTMMLPQWGQFIDHDLTSTAQIRSINGSVPSCCRSTSDLHPACLPIKIPSDDPWLSALFVQCMEFLRSAPASRRDCSLSWREQTNQATSYLDASMIYASSGRLSENSRVFRDGLLIFGRARDDVCFRGALSSRCIRPGDGRSGEQPGLLAMHTMFVAEHNQLATELAFLNPHWSDEKIYQEARRLIGAIVQHVTFREFLPLVLGREVVKLFELDLKSSGYFTKYDAKVNPNVANSFAAAAFRFGHSMIRSTMIRGDKNNNFIRNNVSLHEENSRGDMDGPGSLHRILRGLAIQRAAKRDEYITAELTNHLFQTSPFPFGLDLAAINIQRGRDHGIPPYNSWRSPCGLSPIRNWDEMERVVGPESRRKLQLAYDDIDDIDLFVGGISERPVVGGLVGPTFACIIAQQFSNLRRGDRFWYENGGFESSFTPAQLEAIRGISLAQIICRALGGEGTVQTHIFLPADFSNNQRLPCGRGELAPIDLTPWKERDPFAQKLTNTIDRVNEQNPAAPSRLDLPRPGGLDGNIQIGIDDKLDNELSTKRPLTSGIDNKLDLAGLKRPKTDKLKKKTKKTTPKLTQRTTKRQLTSVGKRVARFANVDNATGYFRNRPIGYQRIPIISRRKNENRASFRTVDSDEEGTDDYFSDRQDWYSFTTERRPIGYQNNQPIYELPQNPTTTKRPYFNRRKPDHRPTVFNYEVPVPLEHAFGDDRQTELKEQIYQSTIKPHLSTFMVVDSKKKYNRPTSPGPHDKFIFQAISSTTVRYPASSDLSPISVNFTNSLPHPTQIFPQIDWTKINLPDLFKTPTETDYSRLEIKPIKPTRPAYIDYNEFNQQSKKIIYKNNVLHKLDGRRTLYDVNKQQTKRYAQYFTDQVNQTTSTSTSTSTSAENLLVHHIKDLVEKFSKTHSITRTTPIPPRPIQREDVDPYSDNDEEIHWIRLDVKAPEVRRTKVRKTFGDTKTTKKKLTTNNHGQNQMRVSIVPIVLLNSAERPDNWEMVEPIKGRRIPPLPEVPALPRDAMAVDEVPKPLQFRALA